MSDFNEFMHYRVLAFKYDRQNIELTESVLSGRTNIETPELRQVCAKLTVELADRIDRTVSVLGISKRLFIERALIEALDQVDAIIECHDAMGGLDE